MVFYPFNYSKWDLQVMRVCAAKPLIHPHYNNYNIFHYSCFRFSNEKIKAGVFVIGAVEHIFNNLEFFTDAVLKAIQRKVLTWGKIWSFNTSNRYSDLSQWEIQKCY